MRKGFYLFALGGAIDKHLTGSIRVDSCHESFLNSELVVEDFDDGRKAVCGAGSVRDDFHV